LKNVLTVSLLPWETRGITTRISAHIKSPASGEYRLWYDFPSSVSGFVTSWADPFVLATVHLAMQQNANIHVRGRVSPSLIRNLEDFQQAWSVFRPSRYRPADIRADIEEEERITGERSAVCPFSGGVDSSFTAFRHSTGTAVARPRNLTAGIMVHGFDIPLNMSEVFESAFRRGETQLQSIGLELIQVATNFRELPLEWSDVFGAGIAAVLTLFRRKFSEGLVPQGVSFYCHDHLVEGSNPMTDHLLSCDSFRIVPDGAGFRRSDKILVLSRWPEALQYLRVCLGDGNRDTNCCRCEKCVRNILTFRALGLGLPQCFENDVTDEQIRKLTRLKELIMLVGYDDILRLAEERGEDGSWVRALRRRLQKNRWWKRSLLGQLLRRARGRAVRLRSAAAGVAINRAGE